MNPIEFSSNLFSLRMEHKMSVEELAELLNVTPETVCEWECAKTSPTMEQMDRLAKIYRIPLDQIVRNPKPRTEQLLPVVEEAIPAAEEAPVRRQVQGEILEERALFEEFEDEEEDFDDEEEEVSLKPRRGKKPRRRWVDVAVIVLLLGIIAAATVFLINPEWFPWLK